MHKPPVDCPRRPLPGGASPKLQSVMCGCRRYRVAAVRSRGAPMDRIADPWGARTPYARDARWPVRIDEYLEADRAAESVERWVQAASVLHSNGDAMDIAVAD